jgi:hypothetical protein
MSGPMRQWGCISPLPTGNYAIFIAFNKFSTLEHDAGLMFAWENKATKRFSCNQLFPAPLLPATAQLGERCFL